MPVYQLETKVPDIDLTVFVAPTATVIGNVFIGKNSSIWFNCVLRGDEDHIHIGENTNVQDLTMVHADPGSPVAVGNNVIIGHGCMIHGCTVEDDCLIGIGAVLLNGAVIGRGSVIAAGAVVLENTKIPPNSLVTGVPAKVKKENPDETRQIMSLMADLYAEKARTYKNKNLFFLRPDDSAPHP